ncbi:cellulose synthase-like protein G3 [Tanacetum coccineum]|uniref:Cellulose synthase-like protein G3 n=1 Tax=Tanacetum coccineum TaxID=301880 RepID=A0ABQ5AQW5_9ASTR
MTNAQIILTQDCDMYSNDPQTPKKALCYFSDPLVQPTLGYVQFPQRFHGLNKDDIYGGEFLRAFVANAVGMDGFLGPIYTGSGCFFVRRVFFGGPTLMVPPEIKELRPDHVVEKPIRTRPVIELAHHVAGCNYEYNTKWGFQIGFRYGSLVEDFITGYQLQCEGWKSIFCHPSRPAFLGDVPISFVDAVTDPWFLLYVFLFLGAYCQDLYDFILFDGTYKRWWNDQRMWLIRGLSPYLFGFVEYIVKHLGITTQGFHVTNKVKDDEQRKRYDQGLMEFGVHSPMFVPLTTASIVNLFALITGLIQTLNFPNFDKLFVQLFLAGFGVLNNWPVYEAMILRSDKGRMPIKTIIISTCLASILCGASLFLA